MTKIIAGPLWMMKKMPKCCKECVFFPRDNEWAVCKLDLEDIDFADYDERRLRTCLLRELPEKIPDDDIDCGEDVGWNDCIEELEG